MLTVVFLLAPTSSTFGQASFRPPRLPAHQKTLRDLGNGQTKPNSTVLRPIVHSQPSDGSVLESPEVLVQEDQRIDSGSTGSSIIENGIFGGNAILDPSSPLSNSDFGGFTPQASSQETEDKRLQSEAARSGLQDYLGGSTGSSQSTEQMEELPEEMQDSGFPDDSTSGNVETIVQRFPNGKKRIVREVAQDGSGNFSNHGRWEAFDQQGNSIAGGIFERGVMQGQWRRQHAKSEGGLFSTKPFNLYQGPFLSVANFKDGELEGLWTIYDQFKTKIFEISYEKGVRNGNATWWYPNRSKMREAKFKDGLLDGFITGWSEAEKIIRKEEYVEGRRIVRNTTFFRPKQPRKEEFYLDTKLEPEGKDDWWKAKPTGYLERGNKVKNGGTAEWYENGQLKKQGQFKDGEPVGRFTWWHRNGNKHIQGLYANGKKNRTWTWWHANGMKQTEGAYNDEQPVGLWRAWYDDGTLRKEENLSDEVEPEDSSDSDTSDENPDGTKSVIDSAQPAETLPDPTSATEIEGHDFGGSKSKESNDPESTDPFGEKLENDGSLPKELFENGKKGASNSSLNQANPKTTLRWSTPSRFDR